MRTEVIPPSAVHDLGGNAKPHWIISLKEKSTQMQVLGYDGNLEVKQGGSLAYIAVPLSSETMRTKEIEEEGEAAGWTKVWVQGGIWSSCVGFYRSWPRPKKEAMPLLLGNLQVYLDIFDTNKLETIGVKLCKKELLYLISLVKKDQEE